MKLDLVQNFNGSHHKYIFDFCPVNYVDMSQSHWFTMFSLFKQGKLFCDGGLGEQPAKYIDVMMFLDSIWNEAERKAIDNAGRKR